VNKLNNVNINYLKLPKNIAGRVFETPGLVKRVVQVRSKFTFSAWRLFYLLPFICTTDFWWRLLVN